MRHAVCIHRCQVPLVKEFVPEGQEAEAVDTAFTVETPVEEFKSSSPLQEEPEPESEPEELHEEEEEEPRDSSEAEEEEPDPNCVYCCTQQPQSITSSSVSRTDSPVIYCYCPSLSIITLVIRLYICYITDAISNRLFYFCVNGIIIHCLHHIKLFLKLH